MLKQTFLKLYACEQKLKILELLGQKVCTLFIMMDVVK